MSNKLYTVPKLIKSSYAMRILPTKVFLALQAFCDTIYEQLDETCSDKLWIYDSDFHWRNNNNFIIIKNFIIAMLNEMCDREGISQQRTIKIRINYYQSDIENSSDVCDNFNYFNCLLSNGPAMILDPYDNVWKEIYMNNQIMFRVGNEMRTINKNYQIMPSHIGNTCQNIANPFSKSYELGKISIIGTISL